MPAGRYMLRPQLLTDCLLAALVWLLLRHERGRRAGLPWSVVALFVAWTNVHPGVMAGLAVLGAYLGTECVVAAWRRDPWPAPRLLATLPLTMVAIVARPGTYRIYLYMREFFVQRRFLTQIYEWGPFERWWGDWVGLFMALAMVVMVAGTLRRSLRLSHAVAIASLMAMTLRHNRVVGELAAGATPLVAAEIVTCCSAAGARLWSASPVGLPRLGSIPFSGAICRNIPGIFLHSHRKTGMFSRALDGVALAGAMLALAFAVPQALRWRSFEPPRWFYPVGRHCVAAPASGASHHFQQLRDRRLHGLERAGPFHPRDECAVPGPAARRLPGY
jgi:hypothetical protein